MGQEIGCQNRSGVVSINAFKKGVEFGLGWRRSPKGSQVMDEIIWSQDTGCRLNNLGGFEGAANGEPILVRGVMKPIPLSQTLDECGYWNPWAL